MGLGTESSMSDSQVIKAARQKKKNNNNKCLVSGNVPIFFRVGRSDFFFIGINFLYRKSIKIIKIL